MASKPIDLGAGLRFPSISSAREHFKKILDDTPVEQRITGQQFDALKVLYEAYCANTDWATPSAPKAFFPKLEQQEGFTTKCFGVEFQDGSTDRFSLDKALTAAAKG
jgi:hypothetical protein